MELDKLPIPPGLPPSDITRIQQSFQIVAREGEQIVSRFYELLFERFPDLQSFFHPGDLSQQHDKFLKGLGILVSHLEHPQELRATLVQLGERHRRYGIESQHYPPVLDTFLQVLAEFGGEGLDGKTYEAWANFLQLIRAIMLETFAIDAPAEDQNGNPPPGRASDNTKRILLIDDDRHLLDLYQSYLEGQGYFCSQVSDVAWAYSHLQMSHYDLVMTDFQMPVMNGIQIRKSLVYGNSDVCPPFLLVTGSLSQEIRKQALESGFVAVLRKPHNLMELGGIISNILKKSCNFSQSETYSKRT
jgi:hemoglobin-like flavoprotein/ActR/RegA family two-component response regulator